MLLFTEDYGWCQESQILDKDIYFWDSESGFKNSWWFLKQKGRHLPYVLVGSIAGIHSEMEYIPFSTQIKYNTNVSNNNAGWIKAQQLFHL